MSDKVVKLNVRGQIVETSTETLTQVPGSGLEAMFSGRHRITEVDGIPFVDKDPDVFSHVLWYMENDFLVHEDVRH